MSGSDCDTCVPLGKAPASVIMLDPVSIRLILRLGKNAEKKTPPALRWRGVGTRRVHLTLHTASSYWPEERSPCCASRRRALASRFSCLYCCLAAFLLSL